MQTAFSKRLSFWGADARTTCFDEGYHATKDRPRTTWSTFYIEKNIKAIVALENIEKSPIFDVVPIVTKLISNDRTRLVKQDSSGFASENPEKKTS